MTRLTCHRPVQTVLRFTLISVFTFSLVLGWTLLGWTPPALSQLPSLSTDTTNNPLDPPSEVTRWGEYETAPIRSPLDNSELFEITSATILNRNNASEGMLPVEVRAEDVNQRLLRVLLRVIRAEQTPIVTIDTLNNTPIIQISDDQSTRLVRLVTVTEPDADFNGKTSEELAREWQKILQDEVIRFKQLFTREALLQRFRQAVQILLGLLIASAVIWFLRRGLNRRQQTLEARYQQQLVAISEAEISQKSEPIALLETTEGEETEARMTNLRSQFLATLQRQFNVKRQLDVDKFLKWALFWIFILMWYIGIARIISIIPVLMQWSNNIWAIPLELMAIWFGISGMLPPIATSQMFAI